MKKICKIALCLTLVIILGTFASPNNSAYAEDNEVITVPVKVTYGVKDARSILNMINKFRTSNDAWYWNETNTEKIFCDNLVPLTYDLGLERIAQQRAAEIAVSYSHSRPNNTSCFTAYKEFGIKIKATGENIAAGQTSAKEVNLDWREDNENYNGQGHRRNMLGKKYTAVGIGHVICNGEEYWVEEFGTTSQYSGEEFMDGDYTVNVDINKSNIVSWSIQVKDNIKKILYLGQTVNIPDYTCLLTTKEYWSGMSNGAMLDIPVEITISGNSVNAKNGKLTGQKPGAFIIHAETPYASLDTKGKVVKPKLSLSKKSVTVKQYQYVKIKATNLAEGDKVISWTSKNSKIATVNAWGEITGVKRGVTKVIVTLKSGKTATIKVKVV